jgi:hypothetical protein
MKSSFRALLVAALLAPLACVADDNPVKRCDKNHYILRQLGCIDPAPAWSMARPLLTYHGKHTATLLDDGRVLVAGDTGVPEMTAEIYDPAADTWTLTGPMTQDRSGHTATRLADGRVLVVGGELARSQADWFPFHGTAEIFDPRTNQWTRTGSLTRPRGGFTASLLPTGEVIVVGGYDAGDDSLATAEIYDPASGQWRVAAASLVQARFWHTATVLPDGNVLIVGGWKDDLLQYQVGRAEIYDWMPGTWKPAGEIESRAAHSATLLDDGRVLVAGGYTSGYFADGWREFHSLRSAEIFDPATNGWSDAGDIGNPRYGHLAAALRGGGALIVQGTESFNEPPSVTYGLVSNAIVYSGGNPPWIDEGLPAIDPAATTVTRLNDGTLLFVGQNRAVLFRY